MLGQKDYSVLPFYLAGWDVAMMPFALNESTKYISPTKTPEYLAGGKPVVSTSIRDVVIPYGKKELVYIADTAKDFIRAIENAINDKDDEKWLQKVDIFLGDMSWDKTYDQMATLIVATMDRKKNINNAQKSEEYV